MTQTKRMFVVQNLDAVSESGTERYTVDHEVIVDGAVVGQFSFGPYELRIWEFGVQEPGRPRKLWLTVTDALGPKLRNAWQDASKSGFFHGGFLTSELVALCSLFLRRRLVLGPQLRVDGRPTYFADYKSWIDKPLVEGEKNLSDLAKWFTLLPRQDEKLQARFILAVRLYHRAVLMIESDPELAYLNLVSSIEVLAHDFQTEKLSLEEMAPDLAAIVARTEPPEVRAALRMELETRERSQSHLAEKFRCFVGSHVTDEFWTEPGRPTLGQIQPSQLDDLLRRVYNARSRFLHSGEPLPPFAVGPPTMGSEIDPSGGVSIGARKWNPDEFIPNVHFFERLVNHVLRQFLLRHQTPA